MATDYKLSYTASEIDERLGRVLPEVTATDTGKFLRVSADGTWVAENIPNAEEASF